MSTGSEVRLLLCLAILGATGAYDNNTNLEIESSSFSSSSFTSSIRQFFKPYPNERSLRFPGSSPLSLADDDDNICNDDFSNIPKDQRCNCSTQQQIESYINWPEFHYCTMGNYPGVSVIVLLLALLFLFVLLATTTDDHLVPALEKVTEFLKLSPNIAGVTLLAFGNGAADVFTSFSAISGGSSSDIGLGAIVGAGIFITTMVLSFIIIPVGEFSTVRRPFVRDIIFFLIPTIFLFLTYRSGELTLLGSLLLLLFYLLYVLVVIGGRYLYKRMRSNAGPLDRPLLVNPVSEDPSALLRAPLLIQNESSSSADGGSPVLTKQPSILNEYNAYATKAAHLRAVSRRPDSSTPGPQVTSDFDSTRLAPPSLMTRGRVHSRSQKSVSSLVNSRPTSPEPTRDYRSKSISFPQNTDTLDVPGREHRSLSIDVNNPSKISGHTLASKPWRSTSLEQPEDGVGGATPDLDQQGPFAVHVDDGGGEDKVFDPNAEAELETKITPVPFYMKVYNVIALVFGWLFWIAGAPFVIGRTLTIPDLGLEEDEDDKKKDEEHHQKHEDSPGLGSPGGSGSGSGGSGNSAGGNGNEPERDIDVVNPTFLSLAFVAAPVLLSLVISETKFGFYVALVFGSVAALWMYQKLPQFSVDRRDGAAEHGEMEVVFPRHYKLLLLLVAFFMSMVWIYLIANELVAVLALIGVIIGMSQGIMGLTILAWGNSIGDLIADYLLAKGGNPRMAAAGCFGGPAFNMMVGLGLGFTYLNAKNYPKTYTFEQTNSMNLAFYFLIGSLVLTLIIVPLCKFNFRRWYAYLLVTGYIIYTIISILFELNVV